ncbi:MAG: hypothetical protein U5L09_07815 [Bacteroidales bacterium]|nr:hypothetical protein [Bacteroidales bacterium]
MLSDMHTPQYNRPGGKMLPGVPLTKETNSLSEKSLALNKIPSDIGFSLRYFTSAQYLGRKDERTGRERTEKARDDAGEIFNGIVARIFSPLYSYTPSFRPKLPSDSEAVEGGIYINLKI